MRTQPLSDARDTTGRAFLCAALRWIQGDPEPEPEAVRDWTQKGSALVHQALWSDWLLGAVGVEVVAPAAVGRRRGSAVGFRRRLAESVTPKALRAMQREWREFLDALAPEQEKPITVTTLPGGKTGVKVIRGKDGACRVVQTVAGWRQAVRLVLAHAVAQNRLRRCPACQQVFVRQRVTASRAGRPAKFCSIKCGQRVAGKKSYEKNKDDRVKKQAEYRREKARQRRASRGLPER